ncbi:MAG: hypothetical protein Q4G02_02470 [bacterium]|nr:hypothetical protein [bacterium]
MADKRERMQKKDHLPTWATVVITIIVTLIVVLLVWEIIKRDTKDQWTRDITTGIERTGTDLRDDWDRRDDKDKNKSSTTATAAPTTKTSTSTSDLETWLENWQAVDCVITDLNTDDQMIYETNANFTKVRFEDVDGGFIVDRDWTYTWDNSTMTGVKIKTNLNDVQENLVMALPATDSSTDTYEVDCYSPGQVDTRRPSGISFDETIKVNN